MTKKSYKLIKGDSSLSELVLPYYIDRIKDTIQEVKTFISKRFV